jgi:multimeric flavodoxin WrbA
MATLLGIVGTARKFGNSEFLVRVALEEAEKKGYNAQILRLSDFDIKYCNGCMRCVIKGDPCPLKDDVAFLHDKILSADGIILGAPDYCLSSIGSIKMLLDRALMIDPYKKPIEGRPGGLIMTLGKEDWIGYTIPIMSMALLFAGFSVNDVLIAAGPGPGEVLLNKEYLERARQMGATILTSKPELSPEGTKCPVCHTEYFQILGPARVKCPLCIITGEVIGEKDGKALIRFDKESLAHHFWTLKERQDHRTNWVAASGPRYMSIMDDIKAAQKPFREKPPEWIKPPRD